MLRQVSDLMASLPNYKAPEPLTETLEITAENAKELQVRERKPDVYHICKVLGVA